MIDLWSILAYAAADDAFRNQIYKYGNTAQPTAAERNKYACVFADADYDGLRKEVKDKVGPVSLMALGEWLTICKLHPQARPKLDLAAKTTQALLNGYASADRQFYQALGGLILDAAFRDEFANGNEGEYGFALNAGDRAALAKVNEDQAFQAQAGAFQNISWGTGGCKDMAIQWAAHPYEHALETPFHPPTVG